MLINSEVKAETVEDRSHNDHGFTDGSHLIGQIYKLSAQLLAISVAPIGISARTDTLCHPSGSAPPTAQDLKLALRMRANHRRAKIDQFLAWPAWDMLLDLALVKAEKKTISVSAVCLSSGAPQTTALRELAKLEDAGLIRRTRDNPDRRRTDVELSETGSEFVIRQLKESAGFFQKLGDRG